MSSPNMLQSSSIFHSRLFTFIVGDNATPITVHSGAVAAISAPLKALMEEEIPNGPRTSANLDNVREEDFVRFCDYIYTNDYANPYPVVVKPSTTNTSPDTFSSGPMTDIILSDQNRETTELNKNGSVLGQPPFKRARTEAPTTPAKPLLSFGRPSAIGNLTATDLPSQNKAKLSTIFEKYPGSKLNRTFGSNNNNPSSTTAGKINQANEDHTNVFIAHAAMFAFADRFDVSGLKTLSLAKLKERLVRLELFPSRVVDVTRLVRYVYATPTAKRSNELRDLVSRYVASEIGVVGCSDEFGVLLKEGGCFVVDFWVLVYGNLLSATQVFGTEVAVKE